MLDPHNNPVLQGFSLHEDIYKDTGFLRIWYSFKVGDNADPMLAHACQIGC